MKNTFSCVRRVPCALLLAWLFVFKTGEALAALQGTVVAWGRNDDGQIPTVPTNLGGVIAIATGLSHNLALKKDGTVVAWGLNDHGQTTVPANLNGVVAIASGEGHNLALRGDGTVAAWGLNNYDQTTVPANLFSLA